MDMDVHIFRGGNGFGLLHKHFGDLMDATNQPEEVGFEPMQKYEPNGALVT